MKCKNLFVLICIAAHTYCSSSFGAELSPEPMAITPRASTGYDHTLWATTNNNHLASLKQPESVWRLEKSGVSGGVAATSILVNNAVHQRVFVPRENGIADLTFIADQLTHERTLTTTSGEQFFGNDVAVSTMLNENSETTIVVSSVSASGKFCAWVGSETSELRNIYCSSEGLADPKTAVINPAFKQAFYFRGQNGTLQAMFVARLIFLGVPRWVVTNQDMGTPPGATNIGPAMATYHHSASTDYNIAVSSGNRLWVATYNNVSRNMTWTSLGSISSPPRAHRSAIHMDGAWFTTYPPRANEKHCNSIVYVLSQNGKVSITTGRSTTYPSRACASVSFASTQWSTVTDDVPGGWSTYVTVPSVSSHSVRFLKPYAMSQTFTVIPTPKAYGELWQYSGEGWTSLGKP